MSAHWSAKLVALDACSEAVEYAKGFKSFKAAWFACERPDWMCWLIGKGLSDDPYTPGRRKFAGLTAAISRRSLKYAGEYRKQIEPRIKAVERWSRRDPRMTLELLNAASSAAWRAESAASSAAWSAASSAGWSAASSAARSAAWSAESAASSAAWSADSAASAAWSADSAASAASSAASSAGWSAETSAQVRLIRKHYPLPRIPRASK